jgi:hypothetical protein
MEAGGCFMPRIATIPTITFDTVARLAENSVLFALQ